MMMSSLFSNLTSESDLQLEEILISINRVYSALVITVGTIGNLYCLYLIRSSTLMKFSSSQYLLALACSDLGFLLSLFIIWLSGAGVRLYHVSGFCQLTNYASYVCCFLSAWYIAALTMERCVVVYRPFYARTVASPNRARFVIGLITAFGLIMNSVVLILVDSRPMEMEKNENGSNLAQIDFSPNISIDQINFTIQTSSQSDFKFYQCLEKPDTTRLYEIFTTMDMIFSFTIPLFITFLCNIFICILLIRANRERKEILAVSSVPGSVHGPSSPAIVDEMELRSGQFNAIHSRGGMTPLVNTFPKRYNPFPQNNNINANPSSVKEKHITLFLVSISLTNLILNLPSYLYRLIQILTVPGPAVINGGLNPVGDTESVIVSILYLLFYSQFAINFILYSCQSRRIRGRRR